MNANQLTLNRQFFECDTVKVARNLLGKFLIYDGFTGKIIETEAYLGPEDLASHARFKSSKRNHLMFGEAGYIYIYMTYGMHYMFNIVAKEKGKAGAILIRALKPPTKAKQAFDGPGKWTKALNITKAHNGLDLFNSGFSIEDRNEPPPLIQITPRIGIDYAGAYKDKPWRFLILPDQGLL